MRLLRSSIQPPGRDYRPCGVRARRRGAEVRRRVTLPRSSYLVHVFARVLAESEHLARPIQTDNKIVPLDFGSKCNLQ